MAWIEAHQELARHPKVRRLAHELDTSRAEAIGVLFMLWWWALDYAPDGLLDDRDDIAEACDRDDPGTLIAALELTGWLDPVDHGWLIHDWAEYAGKYTAQREQRRLDGLRGAHERWHVGNGDPDPTCPLCSPPNSSPNSPPISPPYSPPISPPNGPPIGGANSTEQNRTGHNRSARARATNVENPVENPGFDERLRQEAERITQERIAAGEDIRSPKAYAARIMRDEAVRHQVRQSMKPEPLPATLADTVRTLDETDPPY